jgi:hypothetical protein
MLAIGILVPACAGSDGANDPPAPSGPTDDELPPDEGEGDVPGGTRFDLATSQPVGAHAGDTVVSRAIAVIVPAAGESVSTTAHFEDGTWQSLVVTHATDGTVSATTTSEADLDSAAPVPVIAGASTTAPKACNDSAFNLASFSWTTTYEWSFRAGSTPSTNSRSNVEVALGEAVGNITHARNDCGMLENSTATSKYLGRTTRGTNVVSTTTGYKCGTRDGHSVVGFGVLPSGTLGVTCNWFTTSALESDVKLNDRVYPWYAKNAVPAGCTRAFSVEAIATHEFGHAFGMNHVGEKLHGNLTMSPQASPCSNAPSTLGRGDVLGLRKKYAK